eukprot:TRINITY_DN25700_c0_g1_i1.p1 TRINITY_DN25700_c0_g1~~TRINITY_DN25700_c0_g1_i1.p1  ORF type:complete len:227 (-),score=42.25 TRINITY_DN25700_c0_g1_i1:435-1115(-)
MNFASNTAHGAVAHRGQLSELFKGTTFCKFFARGCCTRGQGCKFAHSHDDIVTKPDLSKTRLCRDFGESGFCINGDACNFAHGMSELRKTPKKLSAGPLSLQNANRALKQDMQELLQGLPLSEKKPTASCWSNRNDACSLPSSDQIPTMETDRQQDMPETATAGGVYRLAGSSSWSTYQPLSECDFPDDFEFVLHIGIKNTFIHVEPQRRTVDTCLRRVRSAPAAW